MCSVCPVSRAKIPGMYGTYNAFDIPMFPPEVQIKPMSVAEAGISSLHASSNTSPSLQHGELARNTCNCSTPRPVEAGNYIADHITARNRIQIMPAEPTLGHPLENTRPNAYMCVVPASHHPHSLQQRRGEIR